MLSLHTGAQMIARERYLDYFDIISKINYLELSIQKVMEGIQRKTDKSLQ